MFPLRQSTCESLHVPMRVCAACGDRREAAELLRFVRSSGRVCPDLERTRGGRGLNLCPTQKCLGMGIKRRVFHRKLGAGPSPVASELHSELHRFFQVAFDQALSDGQRSGLLEEATVATLRKQPTSLPTLHLEGRHQGKPWRRLSWLFSGLSEFTFDPSGVITRPPRKHAQRAS